MNSFTCHAHSPQHKHCQNRMHLIPSTSNRAQRQIRTNPALANPVRHHSRNSHSSRNGRALKVLRFAVGVAWHVVDGDIEACEAGEAAEDEEDED